MTSPVPSERQQQQTQTAGPARASCRTSGARAAGLRHLGQFATVLALLIAAARPSMADPLDLNLRTFYDPNRPVAELREDGNYQKLMSELAHVIGPRFAGPAHSLGALGFEAALELSFAGINNNAGYWKAAEGTAPSTVSTFQMRVRKGLPYSVQVGASLTHLSDSNFWAIGTELTFSLIDGFVSVPDLGLRLSAQSVLGHQDISMLVAGGDLVLSKSFGIAGVVSLQPWVAYSTLFSTVTTEQIEVYPDNTTLEPEVMLLGRVNNFSHRAAIGLRLVVLRMTIGGEFIRSFSNGLNLFTGKIGLDF